MRPGDAERDPAYRRPKEQRRLAQTRSRRLLVGNKPVQQRLMDYMARSGQLNRQGQTDSRCSHRAMARQLVPVSRASRPPKPTVPFHQAPWHRCLTHRPMVRRRRETMGFRARRPQNRGL